MGLGSPQPGRQQQVSPTPPGGLLRRKELRGQSPPPFPAPVHPLQKTNRQPAKPLRSHRLGQGSQQEGEFSEGGLGSWPFRPVNGNTRLPAPFPKHGDPRRASGRGVTVQDTSTRPGWRGASCGDNQGGLGPRVRPRPSSPLPARAAECLSLLRPQQLAMAVLQPGQTLKIL